MNLKENENRFRPRGGNPVFLLDADEFNARCRYGGRHRNISDDICDSARNVIGHIVPHVVEVWRKVVYMKDGLPCKRIIAFHCCFRYGFLIWMNC